MQVKIGDIKSINGKMAIVTEVLDVTQSKCPKCYIQQEGEKYCVLVSDLKPYRDGD
ncbi:MAG: hypothetical protein U9N61_10020 [Euryarchaeota archaeon]|nr:hypothetical protein [Euryarchaeota archaeon]